MTEFMGWLVILGLVFAIAGIYMLSSRIEKHMRDTAEIIVCTNKLILEELKRTIQPTVVASEPTVGVILERRCSHRRAQGDAASERPGHMEQRRSPGRRREDLLLVKKAG